MACEVEKIVEPMFIKTFSLVGLSKAEIKKSLIDKGLKGKLQNVDF